MTETKNTNVLVFYKISPTMIRTQISKIQIITMMVRRIKFTAELSQLKTWGIKVQQNDFSIFMFRTNTIAILNPVYTPV